MIVFHGLGEYMTLSSSACVQYLVRMTAGGVCTVVVCVVSDKCTHLEGSLTIRSLLHAHQREVCCPDLTSGIVVWPVYGKKLIQVCVCVCEQDGA